MRKLFVATATVAIFALLISPAMAGNGKGGGRGGNTTTATSSTKIEDYSQLWLGGTVGFETIAVGFARLRVPDGSGLVLPGRGRRTGWRRVDRPTTSSMWS